MSRNNLNEDTELNTLNQSTDVEKEVTVRVNEPGKKFGQFCAAILCEFKIEIYDHREIEIAGIFCDVI